MNQKHSTILNLERRWSIQFFFLIRIPCHYTLWCTLLLQFWSWSILSLLPLYLPHHLHHLCITFSSNSSLSSIQIRYLFYHFPFTFFPLIFFSYSYSYSFYYSYFCLIYLFISVSVTSLIFFFSPFPSPSPHSLSSHSSYPCNIDGKVVPVQEQEIRENQSHGVTMKMTILMKMKIPSMMKIRKMKKIMKEMGQVRNVIYSRCYCGAICMLYDVLYGIVFCWLLIWCSGVKFSGVQ